MSKSSNVIHPETRIGHVHLRVANLERSVNFYRDFLGFSVTGRYGDEAVFLSAGGYHHHIGLNTWDSKDASPPPKGHTGLYHFAILYPTKEELVKAVTRLHEADYPIDHVSDHGISIAVYLNDPDGIGLELYSDKPEANGPWSADKPLEVESKLITVEELLDYA